MALKAIASDNVKRLANPKKVAKLYEDDRSVYFTVFFFNSDKFSLTEFINLVNFSKLLCWLYKISAKKKLWDSETVASSSKALERILPQKRLLAASLLFKGHKIGK